VAFIGPGRVSIDALAGFNLGGVRWGLLALVLGLVAGGIQLASRRRPAASTEGASSSRNRTRPVRLRYALCSDGTL
jgi:hypothetical protein